MTSKELLKIAINAAIDGGNEIMKVYNGDFEVYIKEDDSPLTIADQNANKVIVQQLDQTGIPNQLITKLPVLNPVSFGVKDLHENQIMYLNVDEITEFYNIEYGRILKDEEIPEQLKDRVLGNFFLFRKVKREVIKQNEIRKGEVV